MRSGNPIDIQISLRRILFRHRYIDDWNSLLQNTVEAESVLRSRGVCLSYLLAQIC